MMIDKDDNDGCLVIKEYVYNIYSFGIFRILWIKLLLKFMKG